MRILVLIAFLTCSFFVSPYDASAKEADLLWVIEKTMSGPYFVEGTGVALFGEDSCIVHGTLSPYEMIGFKSFIETYGPDGAVLNYQPTGMAGLGAAFLSDGSSIVLSECDCYWPSISRYTPQGTQEWESCIVGLGRGQEAWSVASLDSGACIVIGELSGRLSSTFGPGEPNETIVPHNEQGDQMFFAKYQPDGAFAWVRTTTPVNVYDVARLAGLPDSGWVVAGTAHGPTMLGQDTEQAAPLDLESEQAFVFLARYGADGSLAWARKVAQARCDGEDYWKVINLGPAGLKAGADGAIVVAGTFRGEALFGPGDPAAITLKSDGTGSDAFIAKYTPAGRLEWALQAGGPGNDACAGTAILEDGSVLATGNYETPATFGKDSAMAVLDDADGVYLARYNARGRLLFAAPAAHTAKVNGIDGALDRRYVITGSFADTATFGPGAPGEETIASTGARAMFVAAYEPGQHSPSCHGASGSQNRSASMLPTLATVVLCLICFRKSA